jgi:hypothetical protein
MSVDLLLEGWLPKWQARTADDTGYSEPHPTGFRQRRPRLDTPAVSLAKTIDISR